MPTYEYYCTACAFEFEEFQSIAAEAIKVCPKCKKQKVIQKCINCNGKIRRVISGGTGLIFKGSGFYITDYKNKTAAKPKTKSKIKKGTKNN